MYGHDDEKPRPTTILRDRPQAYNKQSAQSVVYSIYMRNQLIEKCAISYTISAHGLPILHSWGRPVGLRPRALP